MLVDDNPETLEATAMFLERRGYRVLPQSGPFGVTALIRREKPDAVVLDVMMPGLSGDSLSAIIRDNSDVPILYFSSMPEEQLRDVTYKTLGATYVLKSEGLEYLIQEIARRLKLNSSRLEPSG